MTSDAERCAEYETFQKIDAAHRVGDLAALRAAMDDPAGVSIGPMPLTIGSCLACTICPSPFPFVQPLLEIGADPNPADHAGCPPLIAALCCSPPRPGFPGRPDVLEIMKQLLAVKSDANERGLNDHTPLHIAVRQHNARSVELLLQAGAALRPRTRIDKLRDASRDGGEGELSRDCRAARCAGGATGKVSASSFGRA